MHQPIETDPVEVRVCRVCLHPRPIDQFRRRRRGGSHRFNQCRSCRNRIDGERRARQRSEGDRRRMRSFVHEARDTRDEHVVALCEQMVSSIGGPKAFLSAWKSYFLRATAQPSIPGVRCFEAVFRLMAFVEQHRAA